MREKDIAEKIYLSDLNRFADLHNGVYGSGKQLLNPRNLHPADSDVSVLDGDKTGIERRRDIHMLHTGKCYSVFGVENQSAVDSAMVVRNLQYDAMSYVRQLKRGKTRNLKPCINTVVYFGQNPWTAPTRLKDMLQTEGLPPELAEVINDYTITVVDVRRLPDLTVFKTDIQYVFGFIQNDENKESLKTYVEEHKNAFQNLREDAFDLLCVVSNVEELFNLKTKLLTEGGGYDMCKGMQDWLEEKYDEGIVTGKKIGFDQGEDTFSQLVQKLAMENGLEKILHAAEDKDYRMQLYKKYGML